MSLRTLEQVQAEYGNLCARLGHISYTVSRQQEDLALLTSQIKALDKEASDLNIAAPAAKASAATPVEASVAQAS